jgi:hypothetical protein
MKKSVLAIAIVSGIIAGSCSRFENERLNLKQSVEKSVGDVNHAISVISGTRGYKILCADDDALKSETDFRDSITLNMVSGIYDFNPDLSEYHKFFIPYKLFERTGESDMMVVNLPQELVLHPRFLCTSPPADSVLKNDFTITASDYHFFYTWFNKFDYKLNAGFTLDSEDLGNYDAVASGNEESGISYSTEYSFTEGYTIGVSYESGDSSVSTFTLADGDDILLKETKIRLRKGGFHNKERLYILTLGNVEIRRGTDIDSIQVYLDGVLQQEAGAKITDGTGEDGSFCHKRDILLTFDDGTTMNLSELLDPSREILRTLFDSLHSMKLAKNIVDYIAIGIYYHSQYQPG